MNRIKTIYVDVDGTLISGNKINNKLIRYLKSLKEKHELILWSAAGEHHARDIAKHLKITKLFKHIISKPTTLIDDESINWIKKVKIINIKNNSLISF